MSQYTTLFQYILFTNLPYISSTPSHTPMGTCYLFITYVQLCPMFDLSASHVLQPILNHNSSLSSVHVANSTHVAIHVLSECMPCTHSLSSCSVHL